MANGNLWHIKTLMKYNPVAQFVLIACCLLVMLGARHGYEHNLENFHSTRSDFIPDANSLKILSLGFEKLLADMYWLAFMQYVGDTTARSGDHYSRSTDYANLVTGLDPNFVGAYFFAAFLIGSEQKNPNLAAEIIDRGISSNHDEWSLPFIAGINQYLFAHDEVKAAKYYRMAAKFPEAPLWLGRQAEILEAKIPSTVKEINVWDSIYNSASNASVKERARVKLAALWIQVYKTSPSKEIKNRAVVELDRLGQNIPSPDAIGP